MYDFKGCCVALCPVKLEGTLEPKCTAIQKDVWGLFIIIRSHCGNGDCSPRAWLLRAGHCKHRLQTQLPSNIFFNLLPVIHRGGIVLRVWADRAGAASGAHRRPLARR